MKKTKNKLNTKGKVFVGFLLTTILVICLAVLVFVVTHIVATLIFLAGVIAGNAFNRRNLHRFHKKDPLYKSGVKDGELKMLWKIKKAKITLSNNDKRAHEFVTMQEARTYIDEQVAKQISKPDTTMPA